ncbi:AAA domain-containing protein [Cohnella candidum]|uniref:DUF2726 domain-containing protein n=1 Tax=Cohnella candidum TaxID=2674991 RepID=A0A3G3K381_9BACL|nr:AAA domain-containing protein [Cohnella candidum]AYQ74902.1 DUF2726 domain-containing protein [Cohnella candidum]
MDENNYLILVKEEDKTAEIHAYEVRESAVWITYHRSSKEYPCSFKDFRVYQSPNISDIIEGMMVYHLDIPMGDVVQIYYFGPKVRIKFNKRKSRIYDTETIRVEKSALENSVSVKILKYWTSISQHTHITEDEMDKDAFLKKQFDKLTFVSPNSALSCFLNRQPIWITSPTIRDTIFPFKFNLSQRDALDHALRSQISIIEGPPGTGKTQTILNILANLVVMQNKKVAVVSGNNAAVQNVKDKLETEGYHFLVAALGSNQNKERFFANRPLPEVSNWKSDSTEEKLLKRITEINGDIQHLMEVEKERARLQQKLSSYRLEQEHFEVYFVKQEIEQIRRLSFYRQTPDKILNFLVDNHIASERNRTNSILHKLKLLIRYGIKDFNRLKNKEIDLLLNFQRKYYQLKIEQLTEQIEGLKKKLDQGSFEMLIKMHQQYSEQLFRHKLYEKYNGREQIQTNEKNYKKNFAEFIDQYPIIISTTHSLRNCIPENFLFDYVIIDEASQVDLLTGALALSCCKQVIIVGDTKQLPQIVKQTIEERLGEEKENIDAVYDYFRQNLLSSMLELFGEELPKVMLKEHYRCHPKIIEFCNQKYYNGQLIAFTEEKDGDVPLLIYRTVKGNHMREVTHGRKGKFNQRELDVIQQEVLIDLNNAIRNNSDIGFTTPYRKQVEKATDQLAKDIESDTIHKYQGREKPIMILSTVLDKSRSGKMGLTFVNDPCMINVAVSRAQQKFILVTDNGLFRDFGSEIRDLIRYMEYSTLDENVIESEIVSVFDLLYKEYSEKLISFKSLLLGPTKYASENITWTLLNRILQDTSYIGLECNIQIMVRNLLKDIEKLNDEERQYINNGASVDFVLFQKFDKSPVMVIEVDGFAYHENNPKQLKRDQLKDNILEKYRIPILRIPTTESGEEQKIRKKLNEVLKL